MTPDENDPRLTVKDLRLLLAAFDEQGDCNEDDFVVLQDEVGAEAWILDAEICNGVVFLIPTRYFEEAD